MFNIIGKVLGTDKVIAKGLELIDDAFTSDEETAEIQRANKQAAAKSKIDLMKAYAPFKVAQRYLALMFSFTFVTTYFGILVMTAIDRETEPFTKVIETFNISYIMLVIIMFYFGGSLADTIMKGRYPKKDR